MSESALRDAVAKWWAKEAEVDVREKRKYRNPLWDLVISELVRRGVDRDSIWLGAPLRFPASYKNDSKVWQMLIYAEGIPAAAIEFYVLSGEQLGKNSRNRMDEILAVGADAARSYSDNSTGASLKPCLAVFCLLEENANSLQCRPVHRDLVESNFLDSEPLRKTSWIERFRDFFRRLQRDSLYDAVCFVTAPRERDVTVSEPAPEMSFDSFMGTIVKRVEEVVRVKSENLFGAAEYGQRLSLRDDLADLMSGFTSTQAGLSATELAVIMRRREKLAQLRNLVSNSGTLEGEIQSLIGEQYWMFGGKYVGVLPRRDLIPLDEHDIPLVSSDESINIVELKRPVCAIGEGTWALDCVE